MNNVYLLFTDVEEGDLVDGSVLQGVNILPDRQYKNFFFLEELINIEEYQVINKELVKKVVQAK